MGLALLQFLVIFAMPRDEGEVDQPGFLVLCCVLPVIAAAAGAALSPGQARRAWIPLTIALACIVGWLLVVLVLWD
jgi:hypothetical protein